MTRGHSIAAVLLAVIIPATARAEEDSAELAKQLSNPVASLVSVPFQHNVDCCFGPGDGVRYSLNIQPVIPLSVNDDWNVIVRTILPVIYQDDPLGGSHDSLGLGDVTQSFFFSPKLVKNGLVWAVGPVFVWPSGTSDLGANQWGGGPTALVLKMQGPVTYGVLANHIWSYAGPTGAAQTSRSFVQPFFAYTWPSSTGVSINTETTYDWTNEQWTVPINVGVSHVYKVGRQPISVGLTGRVYAVSPNDGPDWGVRLTTTLLYPKKKK
jgi:hypothetical protein